MVISWDLTNKKRDSVVIEWDLTIKNAVLMVIQYELVGFNHRT